MTDEDLERIERDGVKQLIGYADLHDDTPLEQTISMAGDICYTCWRRIFFIKPQDLTNYVKNCPTEAVDPLTVFPKVKGEKNDKAKGL